MPTLEIVKKLDKSIACVEFALRKLEDVIETSSLSGATSLSEASYTMVPIKSMLREIQVVLVNAAPISTSVDASAGAGTVIMEWITAVIDVCICTENAISNFSIEAGRTIQNLPAAVRRISTKPVDLFALHTLAIEMKTIQSQLHKIITNDDALMHLKTHNHVDATLRSPVPNIEEMALVGYEALQKSIIDKLLDPTIPQLLKVEIQGEAAGETALAQKIYQSIVVKNHFDVCFWIFDYMIHDYYFYRDVPEMFMAIDILRKLLITLEPGNSSDGHDEKVVIRRIRESLKVKRYLVVIDGRSSNLVPKIIEALPQGNNGSRFLIFHSTYFGEFIDSTVRYQLPSLSLEERLELIFRKPFEKIDSPGEYPPDVLSTARIIAACWGDSPMNLLLLSGHILFNQPFSVHDLQVLRNIAATDNFREFLTFIYNKLPILLRTCFAYMVVLFPVNYLIHANSLIRLWIAEGMIPKEDGRTMEQTAELYLDELIQRGLVHVIWVYYHNQADQPTRVVVLHPKLHDNFNYYIRTNNPLPVKAMLRDGTDIDSADYEVVDPANFHPSRRLAVRLPFEFNRFSSFEEGKIVRGFKYPSLHSLFFFGSVAPMMFYQFNFLRVLAVYQARIRFSKEDRACWLDGLVNLRYLGFIVCWIEAGSLGKKLSRFRNLQTLDLSESFVSGLSEYIEKNQKVTIVGPVNEEFGRWWSPVPDMCQ
ncbi:Disease resistance protein RPP8 [Carex littledalei]|uniref:Disease resistance protein RPP8 n=1 Tax=Carex littledalei TaxID=544730 RepID=A0A833RFG0_9POAL|nr:Disease resistance protein RPP8 [Carex littledalei]